jgi:predicted nucleotidyltransferase
LNTLAYFDIFHYPITNEEIHFFLNREVQQVHIDATLQLLLDDKSVFKLGDFYSLRNEPSLAIRRSKGNLLARQEMKNALKASTILSKFPYIKGLAISGSLSKNFADENTDIDFFIVTASNRLWIARTMLQLFYKLAYIAGKRRWFCLNYYVDEQGMEIVEKNIYTAMEIVTLVPMHGANTLDKFRTINNWTKHYFPVQRPVTNETADITKGTFCKIIEQIFNTKAGDLIDDWLMKMTHRRWQKKVKQHQVNEKGFYIGMMVDRHYSKPDPANFQNKIIHQYQQNVIRLSQLQNKIAPLVD